MERINSLKYRWSFESYARKFINYTKMTKPLIFTKGLVLGKKEALQNLILIALMTAFYKPF